MNEILVPFGTLLGGSLITWLLSRRKSSVEIRKLEAEAENTEIESVQAIITMWRDANIELKAEVVALREEVKYLRQEIHNLRVENEELRKERPLNSERSVK